MKTYLRIYSRGVQTDEVDVSGLKADKLAEKMDHIMWSGRYCVIRREPDRIVDRQLIANSAIAAVLLAVAFLFYLVIVP